MSSGLSQVDHNENKVACSGIPKESSVKVSGRVAKVIRSEDFKNSSRSDSCSSTSKPMATFSKAPKSDGRNDQNVFSIESILSKVSGSSLQSSSGSYSRSTLPNVMMGASNSNSGLRGMHSSTYPYWSTSGYSSSSSFAHSNYFMPSLATPSATVGQEAMMKYFVTPVLPVPSNISLSLYNHFPSPPLTPTPPLMIHNHDSTSTSNGQTADKSDDAVSTNRPGTSQNISSNASNSSTSKFDNKRNRTIFSLEQLERLEAEFEKQRYLVGTERSVLAQELNLNEIQVKVWFQNRRIKWRKQRIQSGPGNVTADDDLGSEKCTFSLLREHAKALSKR